MEIEGYPAIAQHGGTVKESATGKADRIPMRVEAIASSRVRRVAFKKVAATTNEDMSHGGLLYHFQP